MTKTAKKGKKKAAKLEPMSIGWYEWCGLPDLRLPAIKAKIDTGAKTSALHAFNIKPYRIKGVKHVRFDIHPLQRNNLITRHCHAEVIDERDVTSSNGHKEHRYVILTTLQMGEQQWDIELTLSNRDPLKFRMLIGREAMNKHLIIHPSRRCMIQRIKMVDLFAMYHMKIPPK